MEHAMPYLLSPGRIGPLELKNRVIMAPMTTRQADKDGFVTDAVLAYYEARAKGGVGLITVEMASPERVGKHRHFELGIYDDRFLPGLKRLATTIHAAGAKASIQLGHGGGHTRVDIAGGTPVAPSAIPHSVQEGHTEVIIPEEMSVARIAGARDAFANAARRAAAAGFDAVEIHAAHGYLISQFMTPAENLRQDAYGGSLANRARFALEITTAVKQAVPELAVIFRMNGDDFFPGGMTASEAVGIARWAAEAGADAIHMTGGHYRSQPTAAIMIPPMATEPTPFLRFAEAVKRAVTVPVIAVGRFGVATQAEAALAAGKADFVALGRPLLADPDWVAKAATGRQARLCLACNTCVDGMRAGRKLRCLVNPTTGREMTMSGRKPTRGGQRIAVVGAGPAGLSYAASMASENDVTVFERSDTVGGAFRQAGLAPLFQGVEANPESLIAYIEALALECREKGVTILTGADFESDQKRLADFDHVVIATGARYPRGAGGLIRTLLAAGWIRRRPLSLLARREDVRDAFYYRLREPTGGAFRPLLHGRSFEIIGDAAKAGKSDQAILAAYEAAFGPLDGDATKQQNVAHLTPASALKPVA